MYHFLFQVKKVMSVMESFSNLKKTSTLLYISIIAAGNFIHTLFTTVVALTTVCTGIGQPVAAQGVLYWRG